MSIDLTCSCGRALNGYRERVTGECTMCGTATAAVQDEPAEEYEGQVDPATRRLIDDALKTHGKLECPKCRHPGRFIRMALVCPTHGFFGGT